MKKMIPYLMIMVLLGAPAGAWGQDDVTDPGAVPGARYAGLSDGADEDGSGGWEDEAEAPPPHYMLEPEFRTWLGYKFIHLDDSTRAVEYVWPHASATGGMVLHYNPLPRRMDFELDWVNKHDYQAEFAYAYKDIFRLDYRGWSLYHNLDHYVPFYVPVTDFNAGPGVNYAVTARDNRIFLRLKWPDRAFHAFAEYRQFEREGTIQQRFRPSGKASRSRDIEWITRKITAGINGHLGPVEVEYNHRIKEFKPHRDVELLDTYTPPGASRVHNVVPRVEGHSDTVKIHTDMTGRIVGSLTLVTGKKENTRTWARVDYNRAFADLTLIPVENLTLAFKYRYRDLQTHSPAVEGATVLGAPGVTNDPIDRKTHTAEAAARYSPATNFSVKAGYKFEYVERDNAGTWSEAAAAGPPAVRVFPWQAIPYDQHIHNVYIGINTRPVRSVRLKAGVDYTYTQDPAYPTDPMNSFKGKVDATWTPHFGVTAGVYYRLAREENNTADMESARDNFGLLATWTPMDRMSVYANYDYSRYENERNIQMLSGAFPAEALFPLHKVPYRDRSNLYCVGMGYRFAFPLALDAEFHQSWSRSKFRTAVYDPVNAVSSNGLGELTDVKIRETGGMFKAGYDFPKGWGATLEYKVNDYEDMQDKPQNGLQDGIAHSGMVMVSKKW